MFSTRSNDGSISGWNLMERVSARENFLWGVEGTLNIAALMMRVDIDRSS